MNLATKKTTKKPISNQATNPITIHNGTRPILIYSIHNCCNWNEWGTREINEQLHKKEGFYSFIYSGLKERCIKDTKRVTFSLIGWMLETYGKIGLISIHRRKHRARINQSSNNFFELGTLNDQTLDTKIKAGFREQLAKQRIIFDDNLRFNGGAEIRYIHQRYNDPQYTRRKVNKEHIPAKNKMQLAQLEISGMPKPKTTKHYQVVLELAELMEEYNKKPWKSNRIFGI